VAGGPPAGSEADGSAAKRARATERRRQPARRRIAKRRPPDPDPDPDPATRARAGRPEAPPLLVQSLRARCADKNAAYRLFQRASYLKRVNQQSDWVRAAFVALLRCEHTTVGQKRWVAYRLARMHFGAGRCEAGRRRWRQYERFVRLLGIPSAKAPPCPPPRR
jgi:hypothetical protein